MLDGVCVDNQHVGLFVRNCLFASAASVVFCVETLMGNTLISYVCMRVCLYRVYGTRACVVVVVWVEQMYQPSR